MADAPETFRSHLPAMAGSALGILLSATLGSHLFGPKGTALALIGGSLVSGTAAWWGERVIRRSHEVAKARLEAVKARGQALSPEETQLIEQVARSHFNWRFRGIHYRTIALLTFAPLAVAILVVFGLDQLGARSVATLTPQPRATVTQTVHQTVTSVITQPPIATTETLAPTATATVTETPSPSPDPSPSPHGPAETTAGTVPSFRASVP
jgi:hypothetical protein